MVSVRRLGQLPLLIAFVVGMVNSIVSNSPSNWNYGQVYVLTWSDIERLTLVVVSAYPNYIDNRLQDCEPLSSLTFMCMLMVSMFRAITLLRLSLSTAAVPQEDLRSKGYVCIPHRHHGVD